jgi:hypothetical protein
MPPPAATFDASHFIRAARASELRSRRLPPATSSHSPRGLIFSCASPSFIDAVCEASPPTAVRFFFFFVRRCRRQYAASCPPPNIHARFYNMPSASFIASDLPPDIPPMLLSSHYGASEMSRRALIDVRRYASFSSPPFAAAASLTTDDVARHCAEVSPPLRQSAFFRCRHFP